MDARIQPGSVVTGTSQVPGDKSIGHRWLLLGSIAEGTTVISGLPAALDVASSALVFGALGRQAEMISWSHSVSAAAAGDAVWVQPEPDTTQLTINGAGFEGLIRSAGDLDCGNSGTTMRLAMGLLAGLSGTYRLSGDDSLSRRPMERVASPLGTMGAQISTTDGHAPVSISPSSLQGMRYELPVASAQVKSAVLLAGLNADGPTVVVDPARTRDHTERALGAIGATIQIDDDTITVGRSTLTGFTGTVPGDPSSAVFLMAAAIATGGEVSLERVGLNPTRTAAFAILDRMGANIRTTIQGTDVGEPWGTVSASGAPDRLEGVMVSSEEIARCIDEIPVLAALAALAIGESRFEGLDELRHKESDRLQAIYDGLTALGAEVRLEGDTLIIHGGKPYEGGQIDPQGDHRMAMSMAIAALGATGPSVIQDIECAAVSFPGFAGALTSLGARIEPV